MSADFDFTTLWEDLDTVVALESRGVGMNNPMMRSIAKRWCVLDEMDEIVAHESRAMMERAQTVADGAANGSLKKKIAKDAVKSGYRATKATAKTTAKVTKVTAKGTAKLSGALAHKFKEWADHYGPIFKKKLLDLSNRADAMEKKADKLGFRLGKVDEIPHSTFRTGIWASEVCFEDKIDFEACLKLANSVNAIDAAIKQYTVNVRQYEGLLVNRYKNEDGVISKIGYPSNAAIHRASGILGRFTENDVKARPMAGNVIVVTRGKPPKEKVDFAVAAEAKLMATMNTLNKSQCLDALKAIRKIAETLKGRGVRVGWKGLTGIYDEMEKMRGDMENMEGEELRAATLYYKNAMALEDAFTTALMRVGDGLLNWVTASLKA